MSLYICPYCDKAEQIGVSAAFHACNKERWQAKIASLRTQNAELLAALKDCREELEQYESRLSGEDYSNPTLNALIQRAEGN